MTCVGVKHFMLFALICILKATSCLLLITNPLTHLSTYHLSILYVLLSVHSPTPITYHRYDAEEFGGTVGEHRDTSAFVGDDAFFQASTLLFVLAALAVQVSGVHAGQHVDTCVEVMSVHIGTSYVCWMLGAAIL
jgi:hypothetical protein